MIAVNICAFLIICLSLQTNATSSISFPIAGLFNNKSNPNSKEVFTKILNKRTAYRGKRIDSQVTDSYSTALEVCRETNDIDSNRITALIDTRPTNGICDTVCLLCNRLNISHLSIAWEIPETTQDEVFTFYYHPPFEVISKAFTALIKNLQWDKFTIFYEDDESFTKLQDVINTWPYKMDPIVYRKLYPDGENRETFKYIIKVARMSYHLLDCKKENTKKYLKEILEVDNSTEYQSFILTSMDAYTLDFQDLPEWMANVSVFHINVDNDVRWQDLHIDTSKPISLETALTADALNHLESAIRNMDFKDENRDYINKIKDGTYSNPPPLCFADSRQEYEERAWLLGYDLRESLQKTKSKGFTGNIEFDENGLRKNFILHYSKLSDNSKFMHVGHWDSTTDTIVNENEVVDRSSAKTNSVIKVVSKLGPPYLLTNEENGTTYYEGYAVDLIDEIFEQIRINYKMDLKYEIHRTPGDIYGNPIEGTRKWNGIIGELIEHNADIAVCDLTITSERNSAVDFSLPFMSLGISMLFRVPDPEEPDMFSFMLPLGLDVWLYLATTYILVSFVILLCARMCQDDWVNPHPCNQSPDRLQNIWSLYNCLWLTMGSIMTQGCDILPRGAGTRWTTGVWWFFVLIITSSYTANMSTFLSNIRRSNDIKDAKALSEQSKVSYGAMYNTSTYKFFQKSNDTVYSKIWSVMSSAKPTVFTNDNDEGRDRVLKSKGKYVFFMESTAIEYYTHRHCDLKMVGPYLDSKDYGIAMPKNSPYKSLIDNAILSLQELGKLEELKKKWWEKNATVCDTENDEDDSGSLLMKNTSGIFLLLAIGGAYGLMVAVVDFLMNANKIAVKEKVTFREAVKSEWKASLDPRMLHKTTAPAVSVISSSDDSIPERSQSRAASVIRAATSFINFDEIY